MSTKGFEHVTAAQLKGLGRKPILAAPGSKYRSQRTQVDGIWFHSKAEGARYAHLKLLEKAGQIQDLILQPRYALHVREVIVGYYVADFAYRTGVLLELVVEDVKGFRTQLYAWKAKHLKAEYGIVIQEIR